MDAPMDKDGSGTDKIIKENRGAIIIKGKIRRKGNSETV